MENHVPRFYVDGMKFFAPQHVLSNFANCAESKQASNKHKNTAWGIYQMTTKEALNLAGLALGMTATLVWIGLLGFGISKAIVWLL